MLIHWIWLAHRPGVSDRIKLQLLAHFRDPEDVFFGEEAAFSFVEGMTPEARAALSDRDLSTAEQILRSCREKKLQILMHHGNTHFQCFQRILDIDLLAFVNNFTFVHRIDAEHALHERRLTSAVFAHERMDFTGTQAQLGVIQCFNTGE